jgi:hypothetical protein
MRRQIHVALIVVSLVFMLASSATADKRVALVVGNAQYDKVAPLANPKRDAAVIADRLRDLGFEVAEVFDGDSFTLNRAAERFLQEAKGADLALFYFAGHGIQLFDQNFLLARDVDPSRVSGAEDLGLELSKVLNALKRSGAIRHVVMVDACRDNPFSFDDTVALLGRLRTDAPSGAGGSGSTKALGRGLAPVALPQVANERGGGETLLFFAAQPGQVSLDGAGQNSFFVEGLKEELARPDRPLSELFRNVSAYVRTVTRGEQAPQIVSDWTADVALGSRSAARIDYDIFGLDAEKPLKSSDRDLVIRAATGFTKFSGDFIAKASLGDTPVEALSEADQTRAKQLGSVSGLTMSYDLGRDGREVTLHVFFRQTRYVLVLEKEGVRAEVDSCLDGKEAKNLEIALRDLNGDRRPEVWIAFETEDTIGWGTFCILEYKGVPDLSVRRRDNTGQTYAGYAAFRTLLRDNAGWHVSVATDNTIEACGGSGCGYRHRYRFDGEQFVMTNMDGSQPQDGAALPFHDEQEHASNLFGARLRVSQPLASQPWTVSADAKDQKVVVETRVGSHTKVGFECERNGEAVFEQLFIRDIDRKLPAEFALDETFAYGENYPAAPVRIDGVNCVVESMASEPDGGITMVIGKDHAERCLPLLDRGRVLTFPALFREKSLLQVRLPAGPQVISSARIACRKGNLQSIVRAEPPPSRPRAVTDQPSSGTPPAEPGRVHAQVLRFVSENYLSEGSSAGEISDNYATKVDYFGKRKLNRRDIVTDKLNYYRRWPNRTYELIPRTLTVAAAQGRPQLYDVSFEYTFRVSNAQGTRAGRGITRLTLDLGSSNKSVILAESGDVLERF